MNEIKSANPILWKLAIGHQTFGDEDIEYFTGITKRQNGTLFTN
ncbi:hypothetical protein BACI348_140016 [Bacillus altitudinis]|uniref:Uncharacterized protein n=1 Tax=Bacillus altitudinis TaxID=293387 RepID=A0A653LLJ5_BACAB|nr:hypothetical protein BACI348_140016 [Bacillus altitudinis]